MAVRILQARRDVPGTSGARAAPAAGDPRAPSPAPDSPNGNGAARADEPPPDHATGTARWRLPRVRRLWTQIAISQIAILLVALGLSFYLNALRASKDLTDQYEHRAQALAQSVAALPQVVGALSGTAPRAAVEPVVLAIIRSTGAGNVTVVDRNGIRLSSKLPALVGKWFHERVVSLDGRAHLRVDPGKPRATAQARVPVLGPGGRVIGEVSAGFLVSQVTAAAAHQLPAVALATGVSLPLGLLIALLLARRFKRITLGLELDEIAQLAEQRAELAAEQAALRRVATLVACGSPEADVFATIADEVLALSGADVVQLFRYDDDRAAVRVAASSSMAADIELGGRFAVDGYNALALVHDLAAPARVDDTSRVTGDPGRWIREHGLRSGVGSPIFVDGRVWGAVIVATRESSPLAPDAERRIAAFTELAATAIANAQARDDLRASRQRVVDSADAMRRRMERNLHDGVQQQLVTLGLEVGMLRSRIPADSPLREEMEALRLAVEAVHEELRVFSRGLHPSILSHGGLAAALRSLANASPLPVTVDSNLEHRLPEGVEVTAYYVVSEALANAAKHAQASTVLVQVDLVGSRLRIEVRDDGRGGALQSRGSGLVGLRDRVEARSGTMTVTSPPGAGTTIQVDLPVEPEPS